ncbi:MAG: hypothetical protein GY769_07195 [bacterium]|nr:hypothetical protein [bacterium]
MSEEFRKKGTPEDAELEREVRSKRKFSLAEAIGREGADLMKGASPVTLKRQAELEIEQYLESHLEDAEGALRVVLVRRVTESEILLAANYENSLPAMARVAQGILSSGTGLRRFVRAIDAEWGRIYSERPYFERDGVPPHRKDPYTVSSVRAALLQLLEALGRGG